MVLHFSHVIWPWRGLYIKEKPCQNTSREVYTLSSLDYIKYFFISSTTRNDWNSKSINRQKFLRLLFSQWNFNSLAFVFFHSESISLCLFHEVYSLKLWCQYWLLLLTFVINFALTEIAFPFDQQACMWQHKTICSHKLIGFNEAREKQKNSSLEGFWGIRRQIIIKT